jgi:hypothetical protein
VRRQQCELLSCLHACLHVPLHVVSPRGGPSPSEQSIKPNKCVPPRHPQDNLPPAYPRMVGHRHPRTPSLPASPPFDCMPDATPRGGTS